MDWAKWCFADKKFDCDLCRLVQTDQGGIKCQGLESADGVCPENKIPTLKPENYEMWGLFQLMLPGLIAMEGYNYSAIQVVFDVYEIEYNRRPELLRSIVKLIDVLDAERKARRSHNAS